MKLLPFVFSLITGLCICASIQGQGMLRIEGEVTSPLILTRADLEKLPPIAIKAKDHGGKERMYGGVALVEVLRQAGVTLGGQLRGGNLAKYVLISAADGYRVVFSLPEIDPEFASQTILLAYAEDNKPLPAGEGPFRLVVPDEKKHARWIRDIVSIKIGFVK